MLKRKIPTTSSSFVSDPTLASTMINKKHISTSSIAIIRKDQYQAFETFWKYSIENQFLISENAGDLSFHILQGKPGYSPLKTFIKSLMIEPGDDSLPCVLSSDGKSVLQYIRDEMIEVMIHQSSIKGKDVNDLVTFIRQTWLVVATHTCHFTFIASVSNSYLIHLRSLNQYDSTMKEFKVLTDRVVAKIASDMESPRYEIRVV